jgi:molecular chaperone HscB
MAREFLMQQMQWRESLEEARDARDGAALSGLARMLSDHRARLLGEIGEALDDRHDYHQAADAVRRWMFVDKFGEEVTAAEDALSA